MAKKQTVESSSEEIKQFLKGDHLVIGTERTMKNLKLGKTEKVFLAKNCPESVEKDIMQYSSLSDVPVVKTDLESTELGTLCRKPYTISVLSVMKG